MQKTLLDFGRGAKGEAVLPAGEYRYAAIRVKRIVKRVAGQDRRPNLPAFLG
jgi:hypothetical protein